MLRSILPVCVALSVVVAGQSKPRLTLALAHYVQLPITAQPAGQNTMAQLSRVNFMRDEPGGRRFFVNDLNGPLYLLDKQTKAFATYLDFNGAGGRSGLFPRFTFQQNFATGLTNVILDPDYGRNGVFYTIHLEDPSIGGSAAPKAGVVAGLDLSAYAVTPAVQTPTVGGRIDREGVLIEWTDRNIGNATFEGSARELFRLQLPLPIHPLGEMSFNPAARPGDPDWRVMYVGIGDSGTGSLNDIRRLNSQRLDTVSAKILRIVPDLREHVSTSTVSDNGRYRIPADNPFVSIPGARKEIWAVGIRNPHRMSWNVDPARPGGADLFAFNIGQNTWETVMIVRKGANYGYPFREGNQMMTASAAHPAPVPADDTLPIHVTDTVTVGTVKPTYPVIQYATQKQGDAIAGGFVYRGNRIPELRGRLVFGDMTTGRIWYAELADVLASDDGNPATMAATYEIDTDLRTRAEAIYRQRGGRGDALPGMAPASGLGRVDFRFAVDNEGELYVLTKSDGMIRQILSAR